jgi:DNA polymerase elongation subunit (family B)
MGFDFSNILFNINRMEKILFIDIETMPGPLELKEVYCSLYRKESLSDEEFEKETMLEPNVGKILCIGWAMSPPADSQPQVISGEESQIISAFWELQKQANILVGHNIYNFDIPFIWKRSILLNIKPPLSQSAIRYKIRDTQSMFITCDIRQERQPKRISLHNLARLLGFESHKEETSGASVYQLAKENQYNKIYEYCKKDVELTRKIYFRLAPFV